MSGGDRRRYLTETVLDQEFLDWSHDNLDNRLEMVVDIETPTGTIYASDRNKYVGGTFYEALLKFPIINRTVGEWLSPTIQFSQLKLELSNADGRFNNILPQGADFGSWVGKAVEVKVGLAEISSTYQTIFQGTITEVGGVSRSVKSITIIVRDNYEALSGNFPTQVLSNTVYPDLDDALVNKILPIIYGDWTVRLEPDSAIVPAYPVNGKNASVLSGVTNLRCRISENDLLFFDTTKVYLKRANKMYLVPSADITNVSLGNIEFDVVQNTTPWVDSANYIFETGDEFYVNVKGKDLGAYSDNIVWQARDILMSYGGAVSGDFHANWATYRDKSTPAQSAVSNFKSRIWENEPKPAIQYALSLLEQVRLEAFIDRTLKLQINSLHFEDWPSPPDFLVRNWDVVRDTFQPAIDTRNNFNRAQGAYDFHPIDNGNARSTKIYKNAASITQIGRAISKQVVFPNLYMEADVDYQLIEIIRLASAMVEFVGCTFTWRSLLKDIGDFARLDVQIGGTIFDEVPAMIREIGYDPKGISIPVVMWSMAMCPYPGYTPSYTGTVGGYNATITVDS